MISEISMSTILGFEKLGIHVVNGNAEPSLEQRTSSGKRPITLGEAHELLDHLNQLPRQALTNGFDAQAFMGLIHAMSDLGYQRNGNSYFDKRGQPMSGEETLHNLEKYLLCNTLLGYAKRNLGDPTKPIPIQKGYTSINAIGPINTAAKHGKAIGRNIHAEMRSYCPEIVADCLKFAQEALVEHNLSRPGAHNQGETILYQNLHGAYNYLEHVSDFSMHMDEAQQKQHFPKLREQLNLLYQRTKEAANAKASHHEKLGEGYKEVAGTYRTIAKNCEAKIKV